MINQAVGELQLHFFLNTKAFTLDFSGLELRIKSGDMEKLKNILSLPNKALMCGTQRKVM